MEIDRRKEMLERKRELFNRKLDEQRAKVNAMFDVKQAEIGGALNSRQQEIVDAALDLLTETGLNNLSLRDIAKRLNMQAPALYWHFKNKEDLIDFMAEAILQKRLATIPGRAEGQSWQAWLVDHMMQLRRAMLAYPDGGRVVAGAHLYPAQTLGQSFEAALTALSSDGVELGLARHILITATHYTFGNVIETQASPSPEQMAGINIDELLQPYPHMAKVMKDVWNQGGNGDEDYLFGLNLIITGAA